MSYDDTGDTEPYMEEGIIFPISHKGKSYMNCTIPTIPLYMKNAKLCNSYSKTNLEMIKFRVNPLRFIIFPIFL